MECLRANCSARARSRAATATTSTSGMRPAGLMRAAGVIRAAPSVPMRSGSIARSLWRGPWRGEGAVREHAAPLALPGSPRAVLEGIRVVDCSTEIAGPYCTKLLADAGADVIKVEPAAGDPLRSWGSGALFEFLNTSKRSVVAAPGDAAFAELAATADVFIDSG